MSVLNLVPPSQPAHDDAPNLHTAAAAAAEAAAGVVRARFGALPDAAIILGTGLGALASEIETGAGEVSNRLGEKLAATISRVLGTMVAPRPSTPAG